jgi:hypothetical protein
MFLSSILKQLKWVTLEKKNLFSDATDVLEK